MPQSRVQTAVASEILVKAHFQATAPDWRTIYSSEDVHSRLYQKRRAEVLSLVGSLDLDRGATVLDIGCGPGLIAVELAKRGFQVDAIDIVPEMLDMTRDLAASSGVAERVTCRIGDGMQLPGVDGGFDLIVAVGVTEWLSSVDKALREIRRVLKPGGFAIVTAANPYSLHYILDPFKNPLLSPFKKWIWEIRMAAGQWKPRPICHSRRAGTMAASMERAGLDTVSTRRFGFGPFSLFSRCLFSHRTGWTLHCKLQGWADRGLPVLRSMGHVIILLARR